MKKLILIALAAGFVSLNSFGQGQIFIGNSSTSRVSTNGAVLASTAGMTGGSLMPGNNSSANAYMFAAFAYYTGSASTSTNADTTPTHAASLTPWLDSSWQFVGYATNTTGSGRLNDTAAFETVNNLLVGTYANIMVIGWNISAGGLTVATLANAYANNTIGLLYGASAAGSILLGNGTVPPNTTIMGTGTGNIAGFTLGSVGVVPEPATMVLAGLGGLSLLAFRRKK